MQKKDKPLFISSLVSIISNICCVAMSFYTALIMWLTLDISSSATGDKPQGLLLFIVILLSALWIISIASIIFSFIIIIKQKRNSYTNFKTFVVGFIICSILTTLLLIITMCLFLDFKYFLIYGTFTMINIISIIFAINNIRNRDKKIEITQTKENKETSIEDNNKENE